MVVVPQGEGGEVGRGESRDARRDPPGGMNGGRVHSRGVGGTHLPDGLSDGVGPGTGRHGQVKSL